ncbi:MAG: hypothetical protein WCD43_12890 [Candidatus Acidiferrales bacterium]
MRPSSLATDQRILHQYLQDLVCQANTVEEVGILVEVIMSLQYKPKSSSARVSPKHLRVLQGRTGS